MYLVRFEAVSNSNRAKPEIDNPRIQHQFDLKHMDHDLVDPTSYPKLVGKYLFNNDKA